MHSVPLRFASTDSLTPAELRAAPLRSLPHPGRLAAPLEIKPERAAKGAAALGIGTVGGLLEHVPHRHDDRREATAVADLQPGTEATVIVEIKRIASRSTRRRRLTIQEATVADASGPMKAVWFNQPWLPKRIPAGTRVVLHGKCEGRNSLRVSEYELAEAGESLGAGPGIPPAADPAAPAREAPPEIEVTGHSVGLVPVYPATEGLPPARIRELVWAQRERLHDVIEPLPARLRVDERLGDRPAALHAMHFPEAEGDSDEGRRRLALEELLLMQAELLRRRERRREVAAAPALDGEGAGIAARWLADGLPFEPTADQSRAIAAVFGDLARSRPMQRLLMGEVGSGKTVVALAAMLRALDHGMQAALMAPTETLAEQHFATIQRLLGAEPVTAALLTGSTPAAKRRDLLGKLATGELSLVVGTHALIEESVVFDRLAVAVVDEQHRFGVRQRTALDRKGQAGLQPHVLHLTATPIPRTLALTAYGDLDVTALKQLPAGRKPIATHVASGERERERAYERIREELRAGRQAFVVCPLVEESEALQARAATAEHARLAATEFKDFRVVLLHGQMPSKEKQAAMEAFAAGGADVLVATTVVEVGIDVPNATVMLVEDAERYGISQLHQLRGRIGRGAHDSVCLLFGPAEAARLRALADHEDGFRLAEIDLELRGEGEIIGTRQSGLAAFRFARLPQDAALLDRARSLAEGLLAADGSLAEPEHALLADALAARAGADDALDAIPA